jgi:ribose transport system ATP-binding protein
MSGADAVEGSGKGLSVRNISKSFGPILVLEDASFDVAPGEVVALLGENGAGKSTLSNIIAGALKPDSGTITWNGRPYAPGKPADAIASGIGMIHQELKLLPDLSVAENVFVGRLPMRGGRIDRAAMNESAAAQLKRLGLTVSPDRRSERCASRRSNRWRSPRRWRSTRSCSSSTSRRRRSGARRRCFSSTRSGV